MSNETPDPICFFCQKSMLHAKYAYTWSCPNHPVQVYYMTDYMDAKPKAIKISYFYFEYPHVTNDNQIPDWSFHITDTCDSPDYDQFAAHYHGYLVFVGNIPNNFSPETCQTFIDRLSQLKVFL